MNLFDVHSESALPSGCFSEGDKPTRDEFFVFGSNLAGRHGWGAARDAKWYYGAIYGQGIGLQGRSYAIPTKDGDLNILSLKEIERRISIFVEFTRDNPKRKFFITRLGCGLAGYRDEDIAPMFNGIGDNCRIHLRWHKLVKRSKSNGETLRDGN